MLLLADKEIKSANSLYALVKNLREHIAKGELKEIPGGTVKLSDIKEGELWPDDIVRVYFQTIPHGPKYILGCDTYHGFGSFKRA